MVTVKDAVDGTSETVEAVTGEPLAVTEELAADAADAGSGDPAGARKPRQRPSGPVPAQWIPTSSDEERRAFYQERLCLFAKILFWVFVTLLVWVNIMYWMVPSLRPDRSAMINYVSVAGLVALGLVWRGMLKRRAQSLTGLFTWDIAISVNIGLVLGWAALMSVDKPTNVISMLIWANFLIFARVFTIPSRGTRSLLISAGALAPYMLATAILLWDKSVYIETPRVALIFAVAAYSAIAVALTGIGSEVIYGLRKKVQEAQQLGQYTLGEKIGEGGMGTVYKAQHAMLRRPTAIKLLTAQRPDAEGLARFEREVQLTSELTHPNTIVIFDYGRSPDGIFYYAMEYLEGIDLERLVNRHGPQPAGRVIHILAQVCGALDEAHDHGLIHRDVKPANIILCWRGKIPDVAKVLDFGLVKDRREPSITTTDTVAGTPAYLAPEAITSPDEIGPAGDIYAVGAVAYFLLTGTVVFPVKGALEMCVHHVSSPVEPPSARLGAPVSEALEQLILACLSKRPGERPASAAALREALLALPDAGDWSDEKAASWWAQNPPTRQPASPPQKGFITVDLGARTTRIGY